MDVFVVFSILFIITRAMYVQSEQVWDGTTESIPGEYIIVLKKDVPRVHTAEELCTGNRLCTSSDLRTKYRNVVNSRQFITVRGDEHAIRQLRLHPMVSLVSPNIRITAFDTDITPAVRCVTQPVPDIWGLDRLDQRGLVSGPNEYIHGLMEESQAEVTAYVVDTGVDVNNSEFGGRAVWGFTADDVGSDSDLNGHGTHVASTIGAATYGVAKEVMIVAVKVLNRAGLGTASGLISGLEWLVNDYQNKGRPHSVVNLSLGFKGVSEPVDAAVQAVTDAGLPVVVAAGNSNTDACEFSPAHIADVITVGAHDINDVTANFSNWGACLDIWAPGKDILSTTPWGPFPLSGTSMASPHVTGVVARYLSTMTSVNPTVDEVVHWLDSLSTKNRLTFDDSKKRTSPNKILYMDCAQSWTTPIMTTTTRSSTQKICPSYPYLSLLFWISCCFMRESF